MTDTADTCPADNTAPPVPASATAAAQQPPADRDPARGSTRRPWRDPGTMTGAITAAVIGGLIAAALYAWLAHVINF